MILNWKTLCGGSVTKKCLYTIAGVSPLFILVYLLYLIAFNVPIIYTIDIGSPGDVDSSKNAYLSDLTSQERLTRSMSIEDDTFRNMTGSPLYIYITPTNSISDDTRIQAELKSRGDSDLDIALYKKYGWKPLYMKKLDNYTLVKHFNDTSIYARDYSSNYIDYNNIDEWISGNIPKNSTIELYDFDISPRILINKELEYKNVDLEINQTFRGTISFLIYIKDSLNLTLGKQDLNWYNGNDEYSVELYDADGSLIFNDTFPDDGIIDNSSRKMAPQYKKFSSGSIGEGLYELRFVNIKGENQAADSTITNIKINTDKIITQGNTLPLKPGTLFFDLKKNTTLKFYAWHDNAVQNITIRGGTDKNILIDKSLLGKWFPVELPEGSYNISINGNLYISGTNFAFTEESLFQPYNYEINNENNQWIIISNYQVEKDNYGWITARKIFKGSDLELYKDKTIVFGLRSKTDSEVMLNEFKVTLTPR